MAQRMGGSTKHFSIGDKGSMCPRRGHDGWAGPCRNEAIKAGRQASSSIPWQNYWVWRARRIKVFWFFGPVEIWVDRWWYGKVNASDPHTCRAPYVYAKTPLYAFTRSSLHLRSANYQFLLFFLNTRGPCCGLRRL